MSRSSAHTLLQRLLEPSGVRINGDRPWDLQVRHPDFLERVLAGGSLALGESYMDGWWECEALDQFFHHALSARLDRKAHKRFLPFLRAVLAARIRNAQKRSRAHVIGERHYDIGNRLFACMLDPWFNYSCGYWENAETLEEAQKAKMALTCRKLGLKPGMRLLDIGCGWGGLAKYAAETFGAKVHGITVSREQAAFARDFCRGLDVRIDLMDYRDVRETYDRIVSIGMFEHVGHKNYRAYMKRVHRCLENGGLFLLHTIGGNRSVYTTDPWIRKYIFPNSMLPSAKQIASAAEGEFVLEDWHSFGPHYDRTLMAWCDRFKNHWNELSEAYGERFYRMWTYYLLSCAGSFRARRNQVWQIVLSKNGLSGGYRSIR